MKRVKQKCVLYCFVYFVLLNNVCGLTINNFNHVGKRSANLHFVETRNSQYLNQYFKKVMEPITNVSNAEGLYKSKSSTLKPFDHTTESYFQSKSYDKNTLPNYIYPSLHSSPYTPTVIPEKHFQQPHITQKKDSANSSKLKTTSESETFKPRMIPIESEISSYRSRSIKVLTNDEDDSFKPFSPSENDNRALKANKLTSKHNLEPRKGTIEATTTKTHSAQPSSIVSRKDAPEVPRSTKSSPTKKELFTESRGKIKKKYQKYMLPLLLAYKLKFFTLIPLMMGGLVLLTGATGMAGFFFALFASVIGLKAGNNQG